MQYNANYMYRLQWFEGPKKYETKISSNSSAPQECIQFIFFQDLTANGRKVQERPGVYRDC